MRIALLGLVALLLSCVPVVVAPAIGARNEGEGEGDDAGEGEGSGEGEGEGASGSEGEGEGDVSAEGEGEGAGEGEGEGEISVEGDAPTSTVTFTASSAIIANPERGMYRAVTLLEESDLSWLHEEHATDTLVHANIRLDAFRTGPIDQATLDALDDALQVVREDGFEIVLRFAYNEGPYPDSEPDASVAQIEEHLSQLAPVLAANVDVIAAFQAGFVGAWGEWHTSTNGIDTDAPSRAAVMAAILDALPSSRAAQMRNPRHLMAIVPTPLNASTAHNGSDASRIGFHNDCFVASETDEGTYSGDAETAAAERAFLAAQTRYVPVGGETCDASTYATCANALHDMEEQHYSYLNRDYHPDVIDAFVAGGCMDEIEKRLGYRLQLVDAGLPSAVKPGGAFMFTMRLENVGFAAPYNARPLLFVLRNANGTDVASAAIDVDVRDWLPGEHNVQAHVLLPSNLPEGSYQVVLALPAAAANLRTSAAHSIRFANTGTWNATTGDNTIGSFVVDGDAAGDAVANRNALVHQ